MTRFGALALAVLTLALAACGDDDDDADGGSQPRAADQARTAAEENGAASETGGGSEGQDSQRKAPSLAQYIRRADPICRRAQVAIARRSTQYRDLTNRLALGKIKRQEYLRRSGELTEQSGEIAQRAVLDLKELPPPTSRREAIEAYLQGATAQSAILTAQGRAVRQGRDEEVAKLNRRSAKAGRDARNAARRVGFRICGGGRS
jgi:hypothetical protein